MAQVAIATLVAAAMLLCGCSSATEPSPPVAPVQETQADAPRGSILVILPVGRNVYDDRFNFRVWVRSPDGLNLTGTVGSDGVRAVQETPENSGCQGQTWSGDVRPCDPGGLAPYLHFLFEDVLYNGTWTAGVERLQDTTVVRDATGLDDPQDSTPTCLALAWSEPGGNVYADDPGMRIGIDDGLAFGRAVLAWSGASGEPALSVTREAQDDCVG